MKITINLKLRLSTLQYFPPIKSFTRHYSALTFNQVIKSLCKKPQSSKGSFYTISFRSMHKVISRITCYNNAISKSALVQKTKEHFRFEELKKINIAKTYLYNKDLIKENMEQESLYLKYKDAFQKEDLVIPLKVSHFEQLSGLFTLSENMRQLIKDDSSFAGSIAYILMKYANTIYKYPTTSIQMLQKKLDNLLTYSPLYKYSYNNSSHGHKNLFPLLQHFLSADFHDFTCNIKDLHLPNNFKFDLKTLTISKYLELFVIQKSHSFLFTTSSELLVLNPNNPEHVKLCLQNQPYFKTLIDQQHPDFLLNLDKTLVFNNKKIIPIDTKIISIPEEQLKLYSSHSSMSPNLNITTLIHRFHGDILQRKYHSSELKGYSNALSKISSKLKTKKISIEEAHNELLQTNQQAFFRSHILNLSPSFIANASFEPNIDFELAWNSNSETYFKVFEEIRLMISQEQKSLFQESTTYDVYAYDLFMLKVLKKMQVLGFDHIKNYYNLRKILTITDDVPNI